MLAEESGYIGHLYVLCAEILMIQPLSEYTGSGFLMWSRTFGWRERGDMRLIINGQERQFSEDIRTVGQLITSLNLEGKRFVMELNGQILKRDKQNEQAIADGDRLEIVHFVGGG